MQATITSPAGGTIVGLGGGGGARNLAETFPDHSCYHCIFAFVLYTGGF